MELTLVTHHCLVPVSSVVFHCQLLNQSASLSRIPADSFHSMPSSIEEIQRDSLDDREHESWLDRTRHAFTELVSRAKSIATSPWSKSSSGRGDVERRISPSSKISPPSSSAASHRRAPDEPFEQHRMEELLEADKLKHEREGRVWHPRREEELEYLHHEHQRLEEEAKRKQQRSDRDANWITRTNEWMKQQWKRIVAKPDKHKEKLEQQDRYHHEHDDHYTHQHNHDHQHSEHHHE